MGDGKRWFKVWTTILTDPSMEEVHNQVMGLWTRLGALIAAHGDNGNITVTLNQFKRKTHLYDASEEEIKNLIAQLKNINVECVICNSNITVTFVRWGHYQVNTDSYERVKRFREKRNETQGVTLSCNEDKEKEEKRREEKKNKKRTEEDTPLFISKIKENPAYKGIDVDKELARMDAWFLTPKGRGRKKTKAFIVNWLNKIDVEINTTQPQENQRKGDDMLKVMREYNAQ